jgi:hypothetical protein
MAGTRHVRLLTPRAGLHVVLAYFCNILKNFFFGFPPLCTLDMAIRFSKVELQETTNMKISK